MTPIIIRYVGKQSHIQGDPTLREPRKLSSKLVMYSTLFSSLPTPPIDDRDTFRPGVEPTFSSWGSASLSHLHDHTHD
ncbi:hypothetical protein Scep_012468 [Stephania cephalantha]|uniref:Uncharacterized protein n=1 Tax=Stephania cephalantha TaxID=152367 RepID=A0AAP0P9K1_9MAGN